MQLLVESGFWFSLFFIVAWVLAIALALHRWSRSGYRTRLFREAQRALEDWSVGGKLPPRHAAARWHPMVVLLGEALEHSRPADWFEFRFGRRMEPLRRPDSRCSRLLTGIAWLSPLVGMAGTVIGSRLAMLSVDLVGVKVAEILETVVAPIALGFSSTILGLGPTTVAGVAHLLWPIAPLDAAEDDLAFSIVERLRKHESRDLADALAPAIERVERSVLRLERGFRLVRLPVSTQSALPRASSAGASGAVRSETDGVPARPVEATP